MKLPQYLSWDAFLYFSKERRGRSAGNQDNIVCLQGEAQQA